MKLTTLLENKCKNKDFIAKHGLSFYIETKGIKILFDLGPDNSFMKNADKLGIDLKEVDFVVISHGHFDHGKYLNEFVDFNKKARVIISKNAFDTHLFKLGPIKINIGLKQPKNLDRFILVDKEYEVIKGIKVSSVVEYVNGASLGNNLYMKSDFGMKPDEYNHELYLMIEEDKNILISGCSHKGIGNIIDSLEKEYNKKFDVVIGGFHLMSYNPKKQNHKTLINNLGQELNHSKRTYYTCHCTGEKAIYDLRQNMKQLHELNTGDFIEI